VIEEDINGFERMLEGVQSVSEGKIMAFLVTEAYGGFTMKRIETKEKR